MEEWYFSIGARYECVHVSNPKRRAGAGGAAIGSRETYECVETQKPSGMTLERCKEVCTESYQTNAMGQTCAICMSIMTCVVGLRPCGHRFCSPCVYQMVQSGRSITCPACRAPFDPGRDVYKDPSFEAAIARLHPQTYGEALFEKLSSESITAKEFLEQDETHDLELFEDDNVFFHFKNLIFNELDMSPVEIEEFGLMLEPLEPRYIKTRDELSGWTQTKYYSTIIRKLIAHQSGERKAFEFQEEGQDLYADPTLVMLFCMDDIDLLKEVRAAFNGNLAAEFLFSSDDTKISPYVPSIHAVLHGNEEAIEYLVTNGEFHVNTVLLYLLSMDTQIDRFEEYYGAMFDITDINELPFEPMKRGFQKLNELFFDGKIRDITLPKGVAYDGTATQDFLPGVGESVEEGETVTNVLNAEVKIRDGLRLPKPNGGNIMHCFASYPKLADIHKKIIQEIVLSDNNYGLSYPDLNGNIPSHLACLSSNVWMVDTLLRSGEHFEEENEDGHYPWSLLLTRPGWPSEKIKVLRLIINHGVDISLPIPAYSNDSFLYRLILPDSNTPYDVLEMVIVKDILLAMLTEYYDQDTNQEVTVLHGMGIRSTRLFHVMVGKTLKYMREDPSFDRETEDQLLRAIAMTMMSLALVPGTIDKIVSLIESFGLMFGKQMFGDEKEYILYYVKHASGEGGDKLSNTILIMNEYNKQAMLSYDMSVRRAMLQCVQDAVCGEQAPRPRLARS